MGRTSEQTEMEVRKMDALEELNLEELESVVKTRREWLSKVINFVEKIIVDHGKMTNRKIESDHTHVTRELKDFGGFDFEWSSGRSVMVGSTIKIWDQGLRTEQQGENVGLVLVMSYWGITFDRKVGHNLSLPRHRCHTPADAI